MSVRAYKVLEIRTEEDASFNMWHHRFIVDRLSVDDQLNTDGVGLLGVSREEIEQLAKDLAEDKTLNVAEHENISRCVEKMTRDLGDGDYTEYYCC